MRSRPASPTSARPSSSTPTRWCPGTTTSWAVRTDVGAHVEFPSGGGYLATPVDGGAGPALIVLGSGPGDDTGAASACDRFASEGFTALAVPWGGSDSQDADEPTVIGIAG